MPMRASDGTCFEQFGCFEQCDCFEQCGDRQNDAKPVVVLVHGVGLNRHMWQWQIEALAKKYRVIAYDLFGHGESPPPPSPPSLTLLSAQLQNLLDDLGLGETAVVGFSLGGMIARRFAMDHGQRLWALAILNSAHRRGPAAQAAIEKRIEQTRRDGTATTVEAALLRWFTDKFQKNRPDVIDLVRQWVLANEKAVYPEIYRILAYGVEELVAPKDPIGCPTLVMTGEEDYGNSPEMTVAIAAEIPSAETVILAGLRHMAMAEDPMLFNRELLQFLDAHARGRLIAGGRG